MAVPNDATNEARALLLLQDAGLIKLKNPKDINATPKDVTSNPKNLKFKSLRPPWFRPSSRMSTSRH